MNKIAEDLENVAGWHNSKILHGNTNKLRSSQSRRVPFKDRIKTRISDIERSVQHFENVLYMVRAID